MWLPRVLDFNIVSKIFFFLSHIKVILKKKHFKHNQQTQMYRMILKNIFDKFFHILTLEIIFFCQLEMFLWNLFKKIFKKNLKVHNIKKKL